MILLEREPSVRLACYELLRSHVSLSHPKSSMIHDEISLLQAGAFGEERVDQAMQPFSSERFLAFRNVVFPFAGETVQIDHLFITPSFALIIETKNTKGHLKLDIENEQMYREKDGEIQCFAHPVLQVERQAEGLATVLSRLGIKLPIFQLVVFTHSHVFLESTGADRSLPPEICRMERLAVRVRKMVHKQHKQAIYSTKQLLEIGHQLLAERVPELLYDVMRKFGLETKDLICGVWCKHCERLSMKWIAQKWRCVWCQSKDDQAYKRALEVYFRFISPTISNQQARRFLGVRSPDTMRRLLLSMNLKTC
ncbi:nuclease-related domain-containing protein [Jeotgalibacillus marinus]|uniref:Nuclease-related domain-containing protein n=1 Tax=Jeotgalibacillus marinus TaxID=86667 RepID=A0ABV3Q7V9_9BACL